MKKETKKLIAAGIVMALGCGWWEFGVGTNLNLGHDTHFYLDVETTAGGDVDTPWQWNAGVRYSF